MNLFAISDLHLSLSSEKPMDVFRGWDNYTERISANWKRLITDDDVVIIPGDISWATDLKEAKSDF
ncbi:MAG: serine/threonine protein phosphatase, partial [Clostridia bacterium]|nr:serine/threonine protein phosphatase [Clostridia bacterium]